MGEVVYWYDPIIENLGEKPLKLMKLKQAGFPVPDFVTLIGDGSGTMPLTPAIQKAFSSLILPLIGRSSHRLEGNPHPFSGVFESLERIVRLEDAEADQWNYIDPFDEHPEYEEGINVFALVEEWEKTRTLSLGKAYEYIVNAANPDGDTYTNNRVKQYLKEQGITDFNYRDMDLLLMEQRNVELFGMFLTSGAGNKTIIHWNDKKNARGGEAVYDWGTGCFIDNKNFVPAELKEFALLAKKTEEFFGKVQQVEMGQSSTGVELYQSRDFNLANPKDVPRFAHYKTIAGNLHADGYGFYSLPIVVIDALSNITDYPNTAEKYESAAQAYRDEIESFIKNHPEYIAIVKDAEVYIHWTKGLFGEKKYDLLNEITRNAKVVIRGRNQNTIRHEDWNHVESGGISVTLPESGSIGEYFIHDHLIGDHAYFHATNYGGGFLDGRGHLPPNTSIIAPKQMQTGDKLTVLSNLDGVFLWQE